MVSKYNKEDSLIDFSAWISCGYTTSEEKLRAVKSCRIDIMPRFILTVQRASGSHLLQERTGLTPTAYMDRLGLFENGGGCFHCVHMEPEDLRILKKTPGVCDHQSGI